MTIETNKPSIGSSYVKLRIAISFTVTVFGVVF